MNIKEQWLNEFVEMLIEYDESFGKHKNYAYQLASAYFDWRDHDQPEQTVNDAFERLIKNQSYG